jgi:hypothetical protein
MRKICLRYRVTSPFARKSLVQKNDVIPKSLVKIPIPWTPTSLRHSPGVQSKRRVRFASNAFTHMDFGPTSLKVNFIHECSHQVDASATQGQNVFNRC